MTQTDEPSAIVEASDFRELVRTLKGGLNPRVEFSDDFAAMQCQALEIQRVAIRHVFFLLKRLNADLFSQAVEEQGE